MASTSTERNRKRRQANPELMRAEWLSSQYGISVAEWQRMFAVQDGLCAICHQPESRIRAGKLLRLAVDHCHRTGRVRGLLCQDCNTSLGRMADDAARLRAAADYLDRTAAQIAGGT